MGCGIHPPQIAYNNDEQLITQKNLYVYIYIPKTIDGQNMSKPYEISLNDKWPWSIFASPQQNEYRLISFAGIWLSSDLPEFMINQSKIMNNLKLFQAMINQII